MQGKQIVVAYARTFRRHVSMIRSYAIRDFEICRMYRKGVNQELQKLFDVDNQRYTNREKMMGDAIKESIAKRKAQDMASIADLADKKGKGKARQAHGAEMPAGHGQKRAVEDAEEPSSPACLVAYDAASQGDMA